MQTETKRSTVYFDPEVHTALRLKAASTGRSLSELVNEAVRASLRQDQEDLAAFSQRIAEPVLTYEELLNGLKADGKI